MTVAIPSKVRTEQDAGYQVDLHTDDDELVVALAGTLDLAAARYLRERLLEALHDNPSLVRVDLTEIEVLESPIFELLVSAAKRVKGYGGLLFVACRRTVTPRVFEIPASVWTWPDSRPFPQWPS